MGRHVLVAYAMKPKTLHNYLVTAAHFDAEASVGTGVGTCTSDGVIMSADALVYCVGPDGEEIRIAYPCSRFGPNVSDG
eukprot:8349318-Alexandrium_andersonii.AAC.1